MSEDKKSQVAQDNFNRAGPDLGADWSQYKGYGDITIEGRGRSILIQGGGMPEWFSKLIQEGDYLISIEAFGHEYHYYIDGKEVFPPET